MVGRVFREPPQARRVSGAVCQFVEQRRVVRFWRFKATSRWHPDHIRRWTVKRLRMLLDSRKIWHPIGDGFALFDWIDRFPVVATERFQAFALFDIENAIVAEQYGSPILKFPRLAALFRVLVEFPKRNQCAFLASANVSA